VPWRSDGRLNSRPKDWRCTPVRCDRCANRLHRAIVAAWPNTLLNGHPMAVDRQNRHSEPLAAKELGALHDCRRLDRGDHDVPAVAGMCERESFRREVPDRWARCATRSCSCGLHVNAGNETHPALIREVGVRPLQQHAHTVAEADEIQNVDEEPDDQRDEAGQVKMSKVRNRLGAPDGCKVALSYVSGSAARSCRARAPPRLLPPAVRAGVSECRPSGVSELD
jgi:hypothetical protein